MSYLFASLTRIADFEQRDFTVEQISRDEWATGDYVVGQVQSHSTSHQMELCNGEMISVKAGDQVVGALGVRHATLEATGSWEDIGADGRMNALTGAGLFGALPLSQV